LGEKKVLKRKCKGGFSSEQKETLPGLSWFTIAGKKGDSKNNPLMWGAHRAKSKWKRKKKFGEGKKMGEVRNSQPTRATRKTRNGTKSKGWPQTKKKPLPNGGGQTGRKKRESASQGKSFVGG